MEVPAIKSACIDQADRTRAIRTAYTGPTVKQPTLIRRVNALLDAAAEGGKPDEITLRHALNEGWFSDALAWLLDPRGDHGLGVRFLQEFMKSVARERCRPDRSYARRASHLRWSRAPGRGRHTKGLKLGNATAFREFYVAGTVSNESVGDRFCDVVVLDLDRSDGIVLVIENKLFGTNSTGQLLEMLALVEEKYSRAPVREYVYLTLYGDPPTSRRKAEQAVLPRWVALSWVDHVLPVLDKLALSPPPRLDELIGLLRWLDRLERAVNEDPEVTADLVCAILDGGTECLLAELNRLAKTGSWQRATTGTRRLNIVHTSAPSRRVSLELFADCSIAIQSRKRKRAQCDKLLLPFGAPARQVYNLMHITARDLYWIHFGKPKAFIKQLGHRKTLHDEEVAFKPLLDLVWRRRFELQALLGLRTRAKNATTARVAPPPSKGQLRAPTHDAPNASTVSIRR